MTINTKDDAWEQLVDIGYNDPVERGEKLISLWDTFKILIYDGAKQKVLV